MFDDDLLLTHEDNAYLRQTYPRLLVEILPGLEKRQRRTVSAAFLFSCLLSVTAS